MSFRHLSVLAKVWDPTCALKLTERAVLAALVRHADAAGKCFPSAARLAACTALSDRATRAALDSLERVGWISRTRRAKAGQFAGYEYTIASDAAGTTCRRQTRNDAVPPAPGATLPPAPGADKQSKRTVQEENNGASFDAPGPFDARPQNLESIAGYRRIVDVYFDVFASAKGARPIFGKREGKAVRDLLKQVAPERAEQLVRNAFTQGSFGIETRTIFDVTNNPSRWVVAPPIAHAGGHAPGTRKPVEPGPGPGYYDTPKRAPESPEDAAWRLALLRAGLKAGDHPRPDGWREGDAFPAELLKATPVSASRVPAIGRLADLAGLAHG